jgi:hypothetical protein
MKIGFNKYQVFGKIIVLIVIISFSWLFIYSILTKHIQGTLSGFRIIFFLIMGVFILYSAILIIFQLIFLPSGLFIDYGSRTLTLNYFFHKPFSMGLAEISEYSIVYISTKSTRYKTLLLYSSFGRSYILGEFNLEKIDPIQTFLEDNKVLYVGEEKFNFVKYFMNYF